ncbi:MAG: NAD(+)/NADH kinase [Acidobacteriota bacterium]
MSDAPPAQGTAIRRVGIVAKPGISEAADEIAAITAWLEARQVQAVIEGRTAALAGLAPGGHPSRDELPASVDLVVVLGGDGSLLGMADRIAQAGFDIPILGVNFGTLGFLTEITLPDLFPALEATLAGTVTIESRMMLRARVERDGAEISDRTVLNDVAVTGGSLSRIVEFWVWVGEEFVARLNADGIVVATPTGSTAYNLSAGGPIVHPEVGAIVLNPIAPHTLTNRPIVIPASSAVRVQPLLKREGDEAFVTFDGQRGDRLASRDVVQIRRAPRPMRLVRASTLGYYEVLRQKLKWTER